MVLDSDWPSSIRDAWAVLLELCVPYQPSVVELDSSAWWPCLTLTLSVNINNAMANVSSVFAFLSSKIKPPQ